MLSIQSAQKNRESSNVTSGIPPPKTPRKRQRQKDLLQKGRGWIILNRSGGVCCGGSCEVCGWPFRESDEHAHG